jgi:hypothetical protein
MKRRDRILWVVFAAECLAVLVWAIVVHVKSPPLTASAALTSSDGVRFGKSEAERKQIFQSLTLGEPGERVQAATRPEGAIWNRNHDSYFHELERNRIPGVAARHHIPVWMAWWILDEGFHAHWPAAPGVTIYADDAPLAQRTRPFATRHKITEGPATP